MINFSNIFGKQAWKSDIKESSYKRHINTRKNHREASTNLIRKPGHFSSHKLARVDFKHHCSILAGRSTTKLYSFDFGNVQFLKSAIRTPSDIFVPPRTNDMNFPMPLKSEVSFHQRKLT